MLFRLFDRGRPPHRARVALEPLTPAHVPALRLPLTTRFTPETLAAHCAAYPHLCWTVRDQPRGYIVGAPWRRRTEIGAILEAVGGGHLVVLVERLVAEFRSLGAQLVVVDGECQIGDLAVYRDLGFVPLDEIVVFERWGCAVTTPMPPVPLRPYRPEDRGAILAVEWAAFPWLWWNSPAELDHYTAQRGVEVYVTLAGDRVVGYAGFTVRGAFGHLDRLAVHPDYQRQGRGTALVIWTLRRMGELGVRTVTLSTQVDNARSQALYRRLGFRPTRWRYPIYGLWLEAWEAAPAVRGD